MGKVVGLTKEVVAARKKVATETAKAQQTNANDKKADAKSGAKGTGDEK